MAPCIVEMPPGLDFRRFCLVARKLGCASRTTFYSVLLLLDEESNEREGRAPKLEKAGFLASKIDPGTVRATQNRAWAARFERENAKAMRKIYKSRRRSQSNGQSGDPRAFARRPKSAQAPRPPRAKYLQIDRDIIGTIINLRGSVIFLLAFVTLLLHMGV